MRKKRIHFEQVPVAVVEKILEKQNSLVTPDGDQNHMVRKSKRAASGAGELTRKVEVLVP